MKMFFKPKSVFKEEREIASKYFQLVDCRTGLAGHPENIPVIAKYSISDYNEYVRDLKNLKLKPINSPIEYNWSSRISCWYWDLDKFTPTTWFNPLENPIYRKIIEDHGGPFFVRYDTKSKRELWKTHAFASDFKSLIEITFKLNEDYKFENEIIAVREYVKLKTYNDLTPTDKNPANCNGVEQTGVNKIHTSFSGQPIVKEFRIHRLLGQELCRHFYWEPFQEVIESQHGPMHNCDIPGDWLAEITRLADTLSNFYVLDVAQLENGNWTLIEVNEGQHAGVHSDCLDQYYSTMHKILKESSNEGW